MWVYRQGEISHSLAASEGPIHVITRIVCQLERAYIFSALEKKGAEYVLSTKEERQKKYRQSDGFILCDLQSLYLNCEKSLLHPFVIFLPHNVE
mgnify:CR=1 FL=1